MPPPIDKTASIIELIAEVQHAIGDHPEDYCHAYVEHLTEAMTKAAVLEADYWKVVTDLHAEQEKNDRWIALNQSQGRELAALRADLATERNEVRKLHAENEYNIRIYEQRIEELTRQILDERTLVLLKQTGAEHDQLRAQLQNEKDQKRDAFQNYEDELRKLRAKLADAKELVRWRKDNEETLPNHQLGHWLHNKADFLVFETDNNVYWLPIPPMEDEE